MLDERNADDRLDFLEHPECLESFGATTIERQHPIATLVRVTKRPSEAIGLRSAWNMHKPEWTVSRSNPNEFAAPPRGKMILLMRAPLSNVASFVDERGDYGDQSHTRKADRQRTQLKSIEFADLPGDNFGEGNCSHGGDQEPGASESARSFHRRTFNGCLGRSQYLHFFPFRLRMPWLWLRKACPVVRRRQATVQDGPPALAFLPRIQVPAIAARVPSREYSGLYSIFRKTVAITIQTVLQETAEVVEK